MKRYHPEIMVGLFTSLVFIYFGFLQLLLYLFPGVGFGFIMHGIYDVSFTLVVGCVYLFVAEKTSIDGKLLYSIAALIMVIGCFILFPQEGGHISEYFPAYFAAYQSYEEIQEDDLFLPIKHKGFYENLHLHARYITALFKFRKQIPTDGTYRLASDVDGRDKVSQKWSFRSEPL